MFSSGTLVLNILNSNMEKLKKYNFKKKVLRKFVFLKTNKLKSFAILIVNLLLKRGAKGMMNILVLGFCLHLIMKE